MIVTQDNLIKQIADREDIDVATVRDVFKSAEGIIFDHLSSSLPSEQVKIKLFNGISLEREYVKKRKYSKGMFKNLDCPEKIKLKAISSKYYSKKVNDELVRKKLMN